MCLTELLKLLVHHASKYRRDKLSPYTHVNLASKNFNIMNCPGGLNFSCSLIYPLEKFLYVICLKIKSKPDITCSYFNFLGCENAKIFSCYTFFLKGISSLFLVAKMKKRASADECIFVGLKNYFRLFLKFVLGNALFFWCRLGLNMMLLLSILVWRHRKLVWHTAKCQSHWNGGREPWAFSIDLSCTRSTWNFDTLVVLSNKATRIASVWCFNILERAL